MHFLLAVNPSGSAPGFQKKEEYWALQVHLWDPARRMLRLQAAEASVKDGLAGKGNGTRRIGSSSQEKGSQRC